MRVPSLARRSLRMVDQIARLRYTGSASGAKRDLRAVQADAAHRGATFLLTAAHASAWDAMMRLIKHPAAGDAAISDNATAFAAECSRTALLVAALRGQLRLEDV